MSTILFINGPASGHVYPTLGIVEELVAEGERVIYVSSEEFRKPLERLGVTYIAYENFLDREDPFNTKSYLSLVIKILSSYEIILPCILDLTRRYSFDYVIHDSMYGCGEIVAEWLGVPSVSTCTSFIHAERLMIENNRNKEKFRENMGLVKQFASLSQQIRAKYNIRRKLDMNRIFFNEGDINLVFTSRGFQPRGETIGDAYKFIGPSLSDRFQPAEPSIDWIPGRKVVYISMGTVFNNVMDFYQTCFEALASFNGQVILSVGHRIDIRSLQGIPGNFTVLSFVPQLQILQRAHLFITHGGMNSVNEALYHEVPLIVIPMAADQPIVGDRVAELGAGIKLDRDSLTPELLLQSVDEVLHDERYRNNCSIIGESLRNCGGQKKPSRKFGISNRRI